MCWKKKPKKKIWTQNCNSFPDLPATSARLANEYCPASHQAEYIEGQEPKLKCIIHEKPEPLGPYPIDNLKPSGMPDMIIAVLSLHYESKHWSDDQLKTFALKCSLVGIDYVRVMGDWESYFTPGRGQSAFKRGVNNRFDLNQPDSEYDRLLKRLRDILKPYHIKIYFDLIDRCDSDKGPWEYNVNGFSSIYDPNLKDRYIVFFDRVFDILGTDAKYGIGNEFVGDDTTWMRECVLPLAEHMYDKVDKPICFSGDDMTAHHLHGLLSPDVSTKFGIRDGCLVRHWAGTPTQIRNFLNNGSGIRCYAISDDGVQAEERFGEDHGPCVPAGVYCQGTINQRIAVAKEAWNILGERLDHIEFLPREISWSENPDTISQESLDVYYRLALEIWGFDIRRKMPLP